MKKICIILTLFFSIQSYFAQVTDSDVDGISDSIDLDDDNDGILDTAECATANNIFLVYYNSRDYTASVNSLFANIATAQNSTIGGGLTRQIILPYNYMALSGIDATDESQAITNNEYVEYSVTTNSKTAFITQLGYYSTNSGSTGTSTKYHFTARISKDNFATNTVLNNDYAYTASQGNFTIPVVQNNYLLEANTTYKLRVYFFNVTGGSTADIAHDDFKALGFVECDTDGDGVPNRLDLDSDNDGCLDAIEGSAVITSSQLVSASGTVTVGPGSTASNKNLCASGTCVNANGVPTIVGSSGQNVGDSENAAIVSCLCYEPAITAGTPEPTKHGITALGRAGANNGNWPMLRNGAWTALEARSKGFVINRITTSALVNAITNPVEGMMVFDLEANCLKINTDGTAIGWKCFNTQTCP